MKRLQELKDEYPEQETFFNDNNSELLLAMRNIRSETELNHISRYVENGFLKDSEPYQYQSSSCYAAEDALIALLDFKRFLQRYH